MMKRNRFLELLHAAEITKQYQFIRISSTDWLSVWPGDLQVQFALANSEYQLEMLTNARNRLMKLIILNPELVSAYQLLTDVLTREGDHLQAGTMHSIAHALTGNTAALAEAPAWIISLATGYELLTQGKYIQALPHLKAGQQTAARLPLAAWLLSKTYRALNSAEELLEVLQNASDHWPDCLPIQLCLAEQSLLRGKSSLGVDLLHQAAALDPAGIVSNQILGNNHPYRNLWPEMIEADLSSPIPAAVASILGDNLLQFSDTREDATTSPSRFSIKTPPAKSGPKELLQDLDEEDLPKPQPWEAFQGPNSGDNLPDPDEALLEIQAEFERIAERLNFRKAERTDDGRSPTYFVLSSKSRLLQQFGEERFHRLDDAINVLVQAIQQKRGWNAQCLYIDEPGSADRCGLSPADPNNAWQIKLRLAELDQVLARQGSMIGAMLIVGSDKIIPFHHLPNPTIDDDEEIPSDNPYGTTDDNYFIPEWPVGRYPFDDIDLMVRMLRRAADFHKQTPKSIGLLDKILAFLRLPFRFLFHRKASALGYSADIWKKSALAVYRIIGEPRTLMTSPPSTSTIFPPNGQTDIKLTYFNLHGLADSPEWFGQRDPLSSADGEEFPIALKPEDIINSGKAPEIVFTEACYGVNVIGKTVDEALSLRFLASGSHGVIGSSRISYGSITPPLIAADLLGKYFWESLQKHLPIGEALRQAKLNLVSEMQKRQGFLDGEDQKTLISFMLVGDPLFFTAMEENSRIMKDIKRSSIRQTHTKAAHLDRECSPVRSDLQTHMEARVKSIMADYLPAMKGARLRIFNQEIDPNSIPNGQNIQMKSMTDRSGNLVVALSKTVAIENRQHPHFARLTIDENGKVIKLAVSR